MLKAAKNNVTEESAEPSGPKMRKRTMSPKEKPETLEPDYTSDQVEIVKKVKKFVYVHA